MLTFYAILGFCPDFNIITIALADGIGEGILTVLLWQVLVDLCPASYIGTLGGLMYLVRNTVTALTFVVSGYVLQRQKTTDVEVELDGYNHLFLMLVMMSSIGVLCGALMNILDTSKAGALNSRITRWRQSNMETIGLMSMTEPTGQYCGTDGVNNTTVSDDQSMKSSTCKEN
ncbi:uncharacterized protein LOC110449112 [Mizuhopecten yessoensis]|uniref:uncharacterized protein LOC110449112 n=1 Tax=Mizuhopecten yessoensis TaxID=6573 RepID=UPI000B45886E|nr:uncharacterized protein LOC110449112 [Mizuhopecten yessoensis]